MRTEDPQAGRHRLSRRFGARLVARSREDEFWATVAEQNRSATAAAETASETVVLERGDAALERYRNVVAALQERGIEQKLYDAGVGVPGKAVTRMSDNVLRDLVGPESPNEPSSFGMAMLNLSGAGATMWLRSIGETAAASSGSGSETAGGSIRAEASTGKSKCIQSNVTVRANSMGSKSDSDSDDADAWRAAQVREGLALPPASNTRRGLAGSGARSTDENVGSVPSDRESYAYQRSLSQRTDRSSTPAWLDQSDSDSTDDEAEIGEGLHWLDDERWWGIGVGLDEPDGPLTPEQV